MSVITGLYRYPIKGLSPESLQSTPVYKNQGLPLDRIFALAQGDNSFDKQQPLHQSKINYLMLMKNAKMAALNSHYQADTGILELQSDSDTSHYFNLNKPLEQQALAQFFNHYLTTEIRGTGTKLVQAKGHMFSDVKEKVVSMVNLNSIRALEQQLKVKLDPLRFRANVYIDDLPAWAEHEWQDLTIKTVQLTCLKPIVRCAATNVNPTTAIRDQKIPQALLTHFGINQLGMYMTVVKDGILTVGDEF